MPQRKGVVPPKIAEELASIRDEAEAVRIRRDKLVMAALRAGASFREISIVSGLSTNTVQLIGRKNGWPPPDLVAERIARRAENDRWRQSIDDIIDGN